MLVAIDEIAASCVVTAIGVETVKRAVAIADRYRIAFYDALNVAAAREAGCATLFTEDLQHGQKLATVTVRNPFAA